ncbi:MAG: hypothetical protein JWM48_2658, partial [Mycobacterium sp.]|nr:hypothetical protein [Mycobacterium sp.]
ADVARAGVLPTGASRSPDGDRDGRPLIAAPAIPG